MKRLALMLLVVLAVALAGCGSSGPSNNQVANAFKNALDPVSGDMSVSCAHDQGTKYTCKLSDLGGLNINAYEPGIYSVTYDPKSDYVYYQEVGG